MFVFCFQGLSTYNPNVRGTHSSPYSQEPPSAQREQPDGDDEAMVYDEEHDSHQHNSHNGEQEYSQDYAHDESQSEDEERYEKELPEQGTTRGLLAKFQAMQT